MDCLFGGNSSSRSGIYNKDAINYYTTHNGVLFVNKLDMGVA